MDRSGNIMKIGLIGLPSTGKTTFFNLLTSGESSTGVRTAKIPDARIDHLAEVYKPKKVTLATVEVTDIKGIIPGSSSSFHYLEAIRQADALVHVVRAFNDEDVMHIDGSVDVMRDIYTLNSELLLTDLAVIENRIEKINSGKKVTKDHLAELEVLKKCQACLENESLIGSLELDPSEKQLIRTYNFLTEKPMIILINLDEEQYRSSDYPGRTEVSAYTVSKKIPLLEVCARTELEISELDEEDRIIFMEDLGIRETGLSKLASAMYGQLGLISFLTVGEDEVRAWPVKKGISAKAAGGRIHSDIERGFIRAEVVKYEDLKRLGSMLKVKEAGLARLEGKDAVIEDGDIINFRFNV